MKKLLIILCCAVVAIGASAQGKLAVNAGFMFPSTLNATEAGNHWQEKDFWKGYYWDGGIVYKHRLVRYKNGMLRFRFGPQFGAVQKRFFIGLEGGFEYSYVFQNGWEFALIQKNNVNFLHGDTFRNGLLLGIKVPF